MIKKLLIAGIIGSSLFALMPKQQAILNKLQTIKPQTISLQEHKDLVDILEEEKLARDVYLTLGKKWNIPVLLGVAKRSETFHMRMVKELLKRYKLENPIKSEKIGYFTLPKYQKLYKELVKKGSKSKIDALKVGALIEDLDLYDIHEAKNRTDNKDIKFIYSNLIRGSEHHMVKFISALRKLGGNYKPKYISQTYFENILKRGLPKGCKNPNN
ncbi:DUF2202 domain-containing protein [Caminibacter mediatlanticus TB-2]|uniref:DUF2202 domain-containing protein n=1 Tax=Caminibacter mediatlanticus TB-2 TaxID=391592 RepID=A0AAI9F2A3_9BACT|nr:DUF2202 domain-containing protein [Caminibacter mediatlanticus]EDM23598.1 hypothetical protein CMTB2_04917 [Caminibacter mediatlanticus TB-2]QCT93865.1 DUF2202 domain-containing protein [Caminibacter mediatlanticus TB-2]